jgi:hypothetical protein
MATETKRIQLRRGLATDLPTLAAGEFGFTTDTRNLYIGSSVGNVRVQGDYITPEMYGAVGDGTTNDATAIQSAITAAAAADKAVVFSRPSYLISSVITLPNDDLEIIGTGLPILKTASGNSIFKQTNHGKHNVFSGLKFTGNGKAIEYAVADEGSSYYEYDISNCVFNMDSAVYGIYLVGAREGTVDHCTFGTGNGIYRSHSNACFIESSIFKASGYVGTAIYDNGDGSAYSCGLTISNCVIMGYEYGVKISRCDDFNLTGSTIDYNTYNIQILGQDTGSITNCFLGSKDANPAIYIDSAGGDTSSNIIINHNKIVGHLSGANYDCIYIHDAAAVRIIGNYIGFYTRYGISYDGMTYGTIIGNVIAPRATYGTNAIIAANDNNSNHIAFNQFVTYGTSTTLAKRWLNKGEEDPNAQFWANGRVLTDERLVFSDTTYHYPQMHLTKAAGNDAAPTDVSAGHLLGGVLFDGYNDSGYRNAAAIVGQVVSVDTNIVEGKIVFYVTDAAGAQAIPMVLNSGGPDISSGLVYKINGSAVVNQDVTTTATPTFAGVQLVGGTGTTKLFSHQADALADDGTVTLPDATSGMVLVSCNAEAGMWLVQTNGTVTKISGSANTADTDSDTDLCVYDGGTGAIVKNRLGAAGEIRIIYYYN